MYDDYLEKKKEFMVEIEVILVLKFDKKKIFSIKN